MIVSFVYMEKKRSVYDPHIIEPKWQKVWAKSYLYKAVDFSKKPKKYILTEFPYPSGSGFHVGNAWGYTAGDVLARFSRMNNFNVMFPMGWDSFGLPAENYAIKTGEPPQKTVLENISNFKDQMNQLALSFDWSREINTSNPSYYKWTQWIFIQLFKNGLAFKAKMPINWCPRCKSGLANEEVLANGTHERCGEKVEQRPINQWVLKITKYADRLYKDLDTVSWPKHIKDMQRNWIGRSEGAEIVFNIKDSKDKVLVFTTRPDTVFGVTAVVLAPEHKIITSLIKSNKKEKKLSLALEVKKYVGSIQNKTEFERTEVNKEKTGVFTGLYAVNPVNNEKVPVWVADYVVGSYGGGAVMVVPAHDQRDFEFAKKFNLPVKEVVVPSEAKRVRPDSGLTLIEKVYEGYGVLVNSGQFTGMSSEKAILAINGWLEEKNCGKYAVKYKLRDWVFSRQHYWGEPIPMVYCKTCAKKGLSYIKGSDWNSAGWFPISENELPLELPVIKDYKPTSDGRSALAKEAPWLKTKCPNCNSIAVRETDTMPNWAGSNWYFLRYCDPNNSSELLSKKLDEYYMPVDIYLGGPEHTTLHLFYSRFINKFLYDVKAVKDSEPYKLRINRGMILGEDGRKMGKSFGNVINPNDLVDKVGADAVRMYELFLGPIDGTYAWSTASLLGLKRFLDRVWEMGQREFSKDNEEISDLFKKTSNKVTEDIKKLKFHTAIAFMMKYVNKLNTISTSEYKQFLKLLAPFAPFISEELWHILEGTGSVHKQPWPKYDPDVVKDDNISISVQVNGKLRGVIDLPVGKAMDKELVEKTALRIKKVSDIIGIRRVLKVVFIPGRTVNFVV